jgi:hypothetical protein
VDAVCQAHGVSVYGSGWPEDWDDWTAWHDKYAIECQACGAYNYPSDYDRPSQCGNCLADLPDEPFADDAWITDTRDGYSVSFDGKWIGTFARFSRAAAAVYLAMEDGCYWPNVWQVNDHGNVTQLVFNGHRLEAWQPRKGR